jgi:hypothetical protein
MNILTTIGRLVVLAVLCAPLVAEEDGAARLYSGEYSFVCWPNGWRKHPSDTSPEVLAIQASGLWPFVIRRIQWLRDHPQSDLVTVWFGFND